MEPLIRWRERIRRARETAWGETAFSLPAFFVGLLIPLAASNGFTWLGIIASLVATAVVVCTTLIIFHFRRTTRPLWLPSAAVELPLLALLFAGLCLFSALPLWQTLLLAALLAVWYVIYRTTIPSSWHQPRQTAEAVRR